MKQIVFLLAVLLGINVANAQDRHVIKIIPGQDFPTLIAAGKYDVVYDKEINPQNFPLEVDTIEKTVFIEIFEVKKSTKGADIIKIMDSYDCRPANFKELLLFAAAYPDEQREYSIVALGASYLYKGFSYVPMLTTEDGKRIICTEWFVKEFDKTFVFLAVKK